MHPTAAGSGLHTSTRPPTRGRRPQPGRRLSREERLKVGGMVAVVAGLHVVGWGTLLALVAPQHLSLGTKSFGIGIGITAYALGMRHAFDADHIAAIDNTTRKLMADGQRPLSVGFWFSLGHSTIVFALALLLSVGVTAVAGPVANDHSSLHHYTGMIGTTVSGTFLLLIAAINAAILVGIVRVVQGLRHGHYDEASLDDQLANRGLINRLLRPVMRSIRRPGQMYPVGVLFGLGFDTATEVALLVLATAGAASRVPWYAILCLPVLFAAGMSLFDTLDGTFMNFAYGWAFSQPVRKIYYNLTVTVISIVVALLVGGLEVLQLLSEQLHLHGGFWAFAKGFDLNKAGFAIVALFVAAWVIALSLWKLLRVDERWTAAFQPAGSAGALGAAPDPVPADEAPRWADAPSESRPPAS